MVQGGYSIAAGNNALEAQALILFAAALGLAFIEVIRIKD